MTGLPPGWVWSTIGEACLVIGGSTPKTAVPEYWGGDIPWVTPDDLSRHRGMGISGGTRRLTDAGFRSASVTMLPPGTVLFSSRAPIGYTAIADKPLCTNQGFKSLIPPRSLSSRYLYWYLRHATPLIESMASGTTFKEISKRGMQEIPLPVAPVVEQERIVAAIEEHLSPLDATKEALTSASRRIPKLLGRMMEARLGLDAPMVAIGEVAAVGSGATPKRTERRYWDGGDVPWVTSGALNRTTIAEPSALITAAAVLETSVKLWPAGTVLVAMYGEGKTRGRAAELAIESTCNQACAAIQPDPRVMRSRYLRWFLNSRYQQNRRLASGGVQPNLSVGLVKSMTVPVPPLEVQDAIVEALQDNAERLERLRAELVRADSRSSSLRRSILAAAFSGQLVPQDPNDEPASVLLDRIRAERATAALTKRTRRARAS